DSKLLGLQAAPLRDQLFGHSVAEVLLFRIAAQVLERHNTEHNFSLSWNRTLSKKSPRDIAANNQEQHDCDHGCVSYARARTRNKLVLFDRSPQCLRCR